MATATEGPFHSSEGRKTRTFKRRIRIIYLTFNVILSYRLFGGGFCAGYLVKRCIKEFGEMQEVSAAALC